MGNCRLENRRDHDLPGLSAHRGSWLYEGDLINTPMDVYILHTGWRVSSRSECHALTAFAENATLPRLEQVGDPKGAGGRIRGRRWVRCGGAE